MNPAFFLLLIIGLVVLWFLLSFLFKPVGKMANRIVNDTVEAMNDEPELKLNNEGANENEKW